ncbi:hypothetical protein KEM48_005522 [Puccinia striiformis f. sp. tritici PST-130]|nr:hypothetical protein KEM48_005522 [Puccinia striiformis f. sp. tritici PST-130]
MALSQTGLVIVARRLDAHMKRALFRPPDLLSDQIRHGSLSGALSVCEIRWTHRWIVSGISDAIQAADWSVCWSNGLPTRPKGVLTSGVPTVADTFRRSTTYHQYQQDNYSPDNDYEDSNQVRIGEEIYNQQGEDEDENRLGEEGRIWFNGSLTEEEVKLLEEFKRGQAHTTRNSMAELKELMESFISQPKAPHNIPIPETPETEELEFDLRHPTFHRKTPGLDTTIGAGRGSFSSSAMHHQKSLSSKWKDTKWEIGIIEEGINSKMGSSSPLRRYKEDAIPRLIQKAQETKGIRTRIEYHKFIGEFEEIMDYFTRMDYNNLNLDSGDPLEALSIELRKKLLKS